MNLDNNQNKIRCSDVKIKIFTSSLSASTVVKYMNDFMQELDVAFISARTYKTDREYIGKLIYSTRI